MAGHVDAEVNSLMHADDIAARSNIPLERGNVDDDFDVAEEDISRPEASPPGGASSKVARPSTRLRSLLAGGAVIVLALAGLVGWLELRTTQTASERQQRELYLATGRQGALNLTTIRYDSVDADVQRILDSATGAFRDDFEKRAPQFKDVVLQTKSTTTGTITDAGLESVQGSQAQVLVAVSVKSSNLVAAQEEPRLWRMRIDLQRDGGRPKVSNVEFVP